MWSTERMHQSDIIFAVRFCRDISLVLNRFKIKTWTATTPRPTASFKNWNIYLKHMTFYKVEYKETGTMKQNTKSNRQNA